MNDHIQQMMSDIEREFESLSNSGCVVHQVIGSRFLKKWDPNHSANARDLHTSSWVEWVARDSSLKVDYTPALRRVRALVHYWLKGLKPFNPHVIQFTPGEHEIRSKGRVSVLHKLSRPVSVTTSCAPYFLQQIVSNKGLKMVGRTWLKEGLTSAPSDMEKLDVPLYQNVGSYLEGHDSSIILEKTLWMSDHFVLTRGSRYSSVPKNNSERRPINIEPFGNLLAQRSIAATLQCVLSSLNNDLLSGQDRHRRLVANNTLATIDLKAASDSISLDLCEFLLPRKWFLALLETRSPEIWYEGSWYPIQKVSSMGNGFTFELMSLILLAACRIYDNSASVYGDDIIISNQHAHSAIEVIHAMGFTVNHKKTHINSHYRESCGAHYVDGFGYLCSFEQKYPESLEDLIICSNKLLHMYNKNPDKVKPRLLPLLKHHYRLLDVIPKKYHGPLYADVSRIWAQVDNPWTSLRSSWSNALHRRIFKFVERVYVPKIDNKLVVRPPVQLAAALYEGRQSRATLRSRGSFQDKKVRLPL